MSTRALAAGSQGGRLRPGLRERARPDPPTPLPPRRPPGPRTCSSRSFHLVALPAVPSRM